MPSEDKQFKLIFSFNDMKQNPVTFSQKYDSREECVLVANALRQFCIKNFNTEDLSCTRIRDYKNIKPVKEEMCY